MEQLLAKRDTSREIASHNVSQFLTFALNNDVYGINILSIKEILEFGNVTRVPLMPDYISGVINLRGSVVPVVNLALRFAQHQATQAKRRSIIILEQQYLGETLEIGIIVDMVNAVVDIVPGDIEPAPSFGTKIRPDFIRGMGKVNDKLLVLLAIENILSIDELSVIAEVTD